MWLIIYHLCNAQAFNDVSKVKLSLLLPLSWIKFPFFLRVLRLIGYGCNFLVVISVIVNRLVSLAFFNWWWTFLNYLLRDLFLRYFHSNSRIFLFFYEKGSRILNCFGSWVFKVQNFACRFIFWFLENRSNYARAKCFWWAQSVYLRRMLNTFLSNDWWLILGLAWHWRAWWQ